MALTPNPVMQQAPQVQLGARGVQGGGISGAPQINPDTRSDGTLELLLKLGETALAPAIQRRQNEMFLQGAQRVGPGAHPVHREAGLGEGLFHAGAQHGVVFGEQQFHGRVGAGQGRLRLKQKRRE